VPVRRSRRMRKAVAPAARNSKAEGSGTGKFTPWIAIAFGFDNPEAKTLWTPPGVILRILLALTPYQFSKNRLPALSKANPPGPRRSGKGVILYPAWREFMNAINVFDEDILRRDVSNN
jgi:hypothetical protein